MHIASKLIITMIVKERAIYDTAAPLRRDERVSIYRHADALRGESN